MRRSNFQIPTPAFDYSERSDATRVAPLVPLSAVRANVETNRPSLTQRMERARLAEEERRNAELAEAARKADEDRRKRNAEYYRQQREKRERQREQDDLELSKQAAENDAKRDKEKKDWVADVEAHPENYSLADRDFLKIRKIASKIPNIGGLPTLAAKAAAIGVSDAWFGLKDMLGAGALNSISINGENIQSRISFNEHKKRLAYAHDAMDQLLKSVDELKNERARFMSRTGYNPQYAASHPMDPVLKQLTELYNDYTNSIHSLQALMADPTLKTLDDAYKQLYSIRKAGILQTAKNVYHGIVDQFTYDQYKDYVANKRADERRNSYQDALDYQYSNRTGFDYFKSKEDFEAQLIKDYIDELDQETELLRKDYEDNRTHLAESTDYWQVRDSYRKGEQLHLNDAIWNPEYWYYTMPGMMGSSMSSMAQARSMAIQGGSAIGAVAASAAGLGFLSAPLLFAGQVLSTPDDLKSMYDENYGETGMKRLDNLETMLNDPSISKGDNKQIMDDLKSKSYAFWKLKGLSDDYLKEYLYGQEGNKNALRDLTAGVIQSSDPRVTEALIESTRGLEAQLAANNVRTGAEMVVQKAIMMPGLKQLGRGIAQTIDRIGAGIAERQFANRIVANTAGRVTARTATDATERTAANSAGRYANGFRRTPKTLSESMTAGASAGAQAADAMGLGIAGQAIGGTIGAITRGAGHIAKDLMSPRMRRVYETMEEAVMRKYQKIYDKLMPTKEWKKLALLYGVKTARAAAASSMSEAAEEAVQYLNEKEDFASKYGWSTPSIPDLIWNDIRQGGRVLNSYLSLLGITESELKDDQEYWANVKGGFALGGLHTAVMSAVSNATEAAGKYKVADAILKSSVMNRELDKLNRASNTELARQVMAGRAKDVEDMLRDMEAQDARRENPRFSLEDYDEKIKALHIIANVAKDKDIRAALEKSGIAYGTERYAVAVADQYNLYEQLAENSRQRTANGGNIMQAYNTAEFNAAIEEAAERSINQNELLRNLPEEQKALEKANMMQTIREGNHKINKLAALVQLRAQSNTIDDFYTNLSLKFGIKAMRPDAATIRKNIDELLELAIADMKAYDPDFDAKTDELILDYIERTAENIAGIDNEQIQARERANAMLEADRAVILSYINLTGSEAYGRRVDAIIDATKRNASLDWMVNDIYEGDAVNRLMSVLLEEADKLAAEAEKTALNEKEEASEPFDSEPPRRKDLKSAFAKNREKYQARKAKARLRYQNRKNRYKDFKRGNLSATVIPFQDAIISGANELLRLAEEGTYKFALLIDDLRDITDNTDLLDVVPELKRLYIKQRAKLAVKNPSALENMSTLDEVNQYISGTIDEDSNDDPAVVPMYKLIQDRLDEDGKKIVESVSSHYDLIVDDGGTVTIYKNIQAIQDSTSHVRVAQIADSLRNANTSEDAFRNELTRLAQSTPGFPVDDYVKYRNIEGIYEAIGRNLTNFVKGQSVRNGIKGQHAVTTILTGRGDQLNGAEYPANFDTFRQEVLDIKLKLEGNGLGLTIISTDRYVYGTLSDGSNVAVQADVIAANDDGKIYLIDVRCGYKSIHGRYTQRGHNYRSIEELTKALLKQAEDIISNKFRKPVTGLYLLPVIYNDYNQLDGIKLDKTAGGRALIPIKVNNIPQHSDNLEEQKRRAVEMVVQLNSKIAEYNSYVAEANKYNDNYTTIGQVPLLEYTTASEYSNYMDNLTVQYNDIIGRLTLITQDIQKNINTENSVFVEQMLSTNVEGVPTDVNVALSRLEDSCRLLDIAMQYLPDMKAITREERNAVKLIYTNLFEALKNLDELLSMEEARGIDVTNEEELIASVLEKLAEHPENFDKSSMFVQNWWINNFVVGHRNNVQSGVKSVSEQFAGFINTINSWVDTLHNHVVGELDNHRPLQIWYSTLLNNYFTVLLDNAELFASQQDAAIQNPLKIVIEKGRNLVQQFNDTWGAPTDLQFDGPPIDDVDRINRMPVKWANLYNQSLYHSPAVDAMAINEIWYYMSTKPDFLLKAEVRFYIANKDSKYTNHSGQSYTIRRGDVAVFIKYDNNFVDFPLETNINNYPNPSVELIMRVAQLNRGNVRFAEKIRAMLDYIKLHPEYTIDCDITTDKGTIRYGDITEAHNVSEFLFAGNLNTHNLYNIQISQKDNIGVSVVIDNPNGGRFYDVRGGAGLKTHIGNFNDVYLKDDILIRPGLLIYFYDTGNGLRIGVPLQSKPIGTEDATTLTYLLHKYIDGERQVDGYDILSLLKLRLYVRDPKRYLTEYNKIGSMITIQNNGVTIGETFYNIVTQKNDIVKAITAMSNVVDVDMLNLNILQSADPVLTAAYNRIRQGKQSVKLPNGITLTIDDFEHNGTGTTWLGYFMRNNIITTRAIGTGHKQINIGNPVLRLKSNDPKQSIEPTAITQQPSLFGLDAINDPFDFNVPGLLMTIGEDGVVNRTEDQIEDFLKYVNDYFDRVLGENSGKIVFTDGEKKYVTTAALTLVSVGLTTDSLTELSNYAPEAAAPHEAFHKIMELLLPDEERENFYKMYREHTKNGRGLDDRSVAEGLCDMFVDYITKVTDIKNNPWYKNFFRWCKFLAKLAGLAWRLGPKNMRTMLTMWHNVNAGEYAKSQYKVTLERIDRFNKLFGEGLHYTVKNNVNRHSTNLQHVADSGQLSHMVRALGYYIMESKKMSEIDPDFTNFKIDDTTPNLLLAQDENGKSIMDNLCGIGLPEDKLTAKHLAFREIFESREEDVLSKGGKKIATTRVYPNFDAISDKVAEYISMVCGEYTGKVQESDEEETDDYGENMDVLNLNIDKYDKASYEINKLEGVNKKVKLFFATIPYTTRDKDGKIILDTSRNIFGCPTYMPIDEVYNALVNDLHDARSIQDLYARLKKLKDVSTMHYMVLSKFHNLVKDMYKMGEDGSIAIDYDAEQFAIQITGTISSQKLDFIIANSSTLPGGRGKEIRINQSSLGRDKRQLPNQWSKFLLSGQVNVFARTRDKDDNVRFADGKLYPNNTDVFSKIASFFNDVRSALSRSGEQLIDGTVYNVDSLEDIDKIKKEIVHRLHTIGIIISDGTIDHMLLNNREISETADLGKSGLLGWLTQRGEESINPFIDALNSFVYSNGMINQTLVKRGYSELGFVKDLAKWQASYNRSTVDNRTLALNGKELHSISLNNAISRNVDAFNTMDTDNEVVRTLVKFGFNVTPELKPEGSIILKSILKKDPNMKLLAHTYIGFKTDNRGDTGSEYTEEATVDDYMAKYTMLQEGYMLFPTLADKGTWMILSGVNIPGMKFTKFKQDGKELTIVSNAPTVKFFNKMAYIVPPADQLNQMLEYAHTERLAILHCMEDLGYENIPGYQKEGRPKLSNEAKVKNYHTSNKDKKTGKVIEPNGTRFLGLTQITVKENGKLVTYNLNDPNWSSVDLLKLADDKFFSKSIEDQADIMALTLHVQNTAAVFRAAELGVVEFQDVNGQWNDANGIEHKLEFKASLRAYYTLDSILLNLSQIEALTAEFMRTLPHGEFGTWANIPSTFTGENQVYASRAKDLKAEKDFRYRTARGLAIAAMINDVTIRHIISSEEALRCFIGHPGFFKVDYDVAAGIIRDSAYDIQKRIGGLISTGEDNITRLPGMPTFYTVAECNDYEVASTSNVAPNLEEMFVNGNVREMYALKTGKWKEAYEAESVDKLIESADGYLKIALNKAKEMGKKFANAFTGGINVADGAAYITDTMCENLLRMRGAYNGKVKRAFEILRSDAKWKDKQDAYKEVYDAVNIVPFKYTAYGFRDHVLNGDQISDIAVPYYDKFALFPLFNGIATGNLGSIYKKMQDEGVDELLMTSAVKVGSQGAVSYDGTSIPAKFNKYVQYYSDLRRQLNTDPEDGDNITAGTLMIKIALQNLRLERDNYIDTRIGQPVSGKLILDRLMQSINQLAISGAISMQNMFCLEGSTVIDPEKLSTYLKDQLGARNANKAVTEVILTTTNPETGVKELVAPLAATPDASWIESIVISTVNKHIIDIVTPGSSFTQRSVFAMEGKQQEGEGGIQSDANMDNTINDGDKLLMLNEDGSMDAVITMDYFDKLFGKQLAGMSFNQKKEWLLRHNVIGKNAKANTIGYRIPTQAQSSIHALRFVDVIEAAQATIIVPEEFTKITGADFDIDHLYLASYNYNTSVSEDGIEYVTTTFNPTEDDGRYLDQYNQNNILDCLLTLLKDSKNSMNSLYKSIDNDTELITSIADQVPESGSTKHLPYNFGTLHELVVRKNDYITGKTGIGPFALNVTNQVLTQLYGVRFKHTQFAEMTGIESFDHIIDNQDNYISSWLSAFINAHVDIVKDPYISKLNVNPYTYNMVNLLIRSGYGDLTMWFVSQPIIRAMAEASSRAKSQYTRDQEKAKSAYAAEQYAVKEAILNYMTEAEIDKKVIDRYTKSTNKSDIKVRINTILWLKDHEEVLKQIATHPGALKVTVDGVDYDVNFVLKMVFYSWKILEPKAIAIGDFVQHTKIDTRKHGKDLISINNYRDAYNKLFHPVDPDKSPWDIASLRYLERYSWIGIKTDLAISAPSMILGGQTFNANPEFLKAVFRFANFLSTTGGSLNNDTLKLISRSLQTAVKSEYMVEYVLNNLCKAGQTASEYIRELFLGTNSMNARLTRLKNQIETNTAYARLANNHLINQIYSEIEELPTFAYDKQVEKPAFITILNNVDNSRVNSELLIDGWEDLLRDEDKFVRKFANDLIIYAFMSSGEFKGWNKMFKYVPPAWILGQYNPGYKSYAQYIKDALQKSVGDYLKYFEDIISNNAFDNKLVRKMPYKNSDDTENFIDYNTIVKIGKPIAGDQNADRYILVRDGKGYSVSDYNLYKLVDYILYNGDDEYVPVYVRIKKKGYSTSGYDVYEYGWDFNYGENENSAMAKFDVDEAIARATAFIGTESQLIAQDDDRLARAVADVYLGKIDPETPSGGTGTQNVTIDLHQTKTEAYGVEIDSDLIHSYKNWLELHPGGIVAYRVNKSTFNTPEAVQNGIIGNPFDWLKYGNEKAGLMFYNWLTTGNNYNEPLANEPFRLEILKKLMSSNDQISTPILYYKELGYMSHATILGYLASNKHLIYKLLSLQGNTVTKTVEPGAHIATRGYKKGDPQKHPEFNYVFTENAQAYIASAPQSDRTIDADLFANTGVPTTPDRVKLNVSDVNGTNQAGIRTDEQGNITPNAYGIVVKKYQLNESGLFVAKEGQFNDTDEDFKLFKDLNEDMFNRIENSSNDVIIFPSQMALGKAALPKKFAEWLQTQLLDRFGVVSSVIKNDRSDYDGYGLLIERVEPKESNLLQDREYDWKYEEDSGYSGVLEELPPKVRMNGGVVNRPHYEFGRIYLTENEKQFVDEKITATIDGVDYWTEDISEISELHNRGMFNIDTFGEQPKDDNNITVAIPDEMKGWIDDLYDENFIDEHDFDESGEKISKRAIDFIYFLKEHGIKHVVDSLAIMRNELDLTNEELFNSSFKDIVYNYMVSMRERDLIDEVDNISYSYTDKRQLELFSDEDFELTEKEKEEAKRYKEGCEGGKV